MRVISSGPLHPLHKGTISSGRVNEVMQYSWFNRNLKWIYTLPAVIFVLLMMLFPIIYTFRISFYEWSMSATTPPLFVGLSNYIALFKDERFWHATGSTFYFTIMALGLEVILGIAIALLLSREFKGKNIVKTVFLLPMVATPVAMGLVWMLIYEPTIGVANMMLKSMGLKPLLWLASPNQVIPSLVIVDVSAMDTNDCPNYYGRLSDTSN